MKKYLKGAAVISLIAIINVLLIPSHNVSGSDKSPTVERGWWQRPGIGVSYTVESRPGWAWNRNYKKYNKSLMDENGGLKFEGPYLKVEQFVDLSKEVGADYHMLYAKWHDGICFFDTKLTNWNTPEDYMAGFSRLSKERDIPFMIYYSNIFDHNPQFDHIQPFPWSTFSYIKHPEYLRYLEGQYRELIEQYEPDGMWLDWYAEKRTTQKQNDTVTTSINFIRENYPEVVIGFNNSSNYKSAIELLDYTTEEFHSLGSTNPDVEGYIKSKTLTKVFNHLLPLMVTFHSGSATGWERANNRRRDFQHPWSGITPVGKGWQDPSLRSDTNNLPRIAAMVMACGGRNTMQVNIKMDGYIFDDNVRQMRIVGDWYRPRKHLFQGTTPLRYEGDTAPGISGLPEGYKTIASKQGDDVLIHIIKVDGSETLSEIWISKDEWPEIKEVYLEPGHRSLQMEKRDGSISLYLDESCVDPVDTIIRLQF
jgi:alpha-L-fucosidase